MVALPFAAKSFDVIFSIGVLHHTPDTKAYFQKLVPLLKAGGNNRSLGVSARGCLPPTRTMRKTPSSYW
ncbi:MAG: class I SAM-dependent methyltransferase [Gammaproteobacteria bacterium]